MEVGEKGGIVVDAVVGLQELKDFAGAKEVHLVVMGRSYEVAVGAVLVIGNEGIRRATEIPALLDYGNIQSSSLGDPVLVIVLKSGRFQVVVYAGWIGGDIVREQKVGIYIGVLAAGTGVVVFNPGLCCIILQKIIDTGQPVLAVIHKLEAGAAIVYIGTCRHVRVAVGVVGDGKAIQRADPVEDNAGDFAGDCSRWQVVLEFCTGRQAEKEKEQTCRGRQNRSFFHGYKFRG